VKKTLIASVLVLSVSFGFGMGVSFLTGMDGALAREATLPTITEIDSLPEASVRTRSGDQVSLADLRGDGATAFVIFSTKCGMSFAEALVWQRLSESLERSGMSLVSRHSSNVG